jgi:hypothetical protein
VLSEDDRTIAIASTASMATDYLLAFRPEPEESAATTTATAADEQEAA